MNSRAVIADKDPLVYITLRTVGDCETTGRSEESTAKKQLVTVTTPTGVGREDYHLQDAVTE